MVNTPISWSKSEHICCKNVTYIDNVPSRPFPFLHALIKYENEKEKALLLALLLQQNIFFLDLTSNEQIHMESNVNNYRVITR